MRQRSHAAVARLIAVATVVAAGAIALYLAYIIIESRCDDHCVADTRSEAYEGASWRDISDSWQWTAGFVIATAGFVVLVAWALAVASHRTRLATPLFTISIVLFGVWAVAF